MTRYDPIGSQEAILDALLQAVGIDWLAKIFIGVNVVIPLGRGGHANLLRRLEILQDAPPAALFPGAAPVALVHDDQVEKILGILLVKLLACSRVIQRLVNGKIDLPALDRSPLDLVQRLTHG